MTDLQIEIAEAIKKTLPQSIGAELNAELAALAKFRERAASNIVDWKALQTENTKAFETIGALRDELGAHQLLKERETRVAVREAQQDNREFQVKMYDQRHTEMLGLVGLVFKSPTFRTVASGMAPVPVAGGSYNGQSNPGFVLSSSFNTTTEKTEG